MPSRTTGRRPLERLATPLQIARALGYIHPEENHPPRREAGQCPRGGVGRVKLMDFGIAKAEGAALTRAGSRSALRTTWRRNR